jgi:type II secretory pathway predicted ATPase ExeA
MYSDTAVLRYPYIYLTNYIYLTKSFLSPLSTLIFPLMYISSPEAMHQFGKQLAHQHQILLLSGNLGAGKTTLAKGFAEGL